MAFLDFLSGKIKCPNCGREGAKKSGDGYKCPNPHCKWFDSALAPGASSQQVMTPSGMTVKSASGRSIGISYRSFKGELMTFDVDPESVMRKKNHLSVKTSSSRSRIALLVDRIQNLSEVEAALPQRVAPGQAYPTARERQVLGYHKKYKTASPLYEEIRAKYPNW
ncbi:MAG TPA: hypothetical protein VKV95_04860 [Terriglobia bacterium]|nr:hypothetical protein [Terriglobia bacterium]